MKAISTEKETMSSREIAELTGKEHKHVMEAIRKMEATWVQLGQPNFRPSYYINSQNKQQAEYQLSKSECLYIATKFSDEARAKLILRWEKLEKQAADPAFTSMEYARKLDTLVDYLLTENAGQELFAAVREELVQAGVDAKAASIGIYQMVEKATGKKKKDLIDQFQPTPYTKKSQIQTNEQYAFAGKDQSYLAKARSCLATKLASYSNEFDLNSFFQFLTILIKARLQDGAEIRVQSQRIAKKPTNQRSIFSNPALPAYQVKQLVAF